MMLIILAIIAWFAILLFSIYVIILACPKAKEPEDKALICEYAHRGLHKDGVPENSLAAFALACEKGFAMELDVHLSKDKEVMVFHDGSLKRMTGCDKGIHELTYAELSELRLAGTDEKIPTLREVLELVDGRVPLLVELKGESTDTSLCPEVAKLLREYKGSYCIESFNPLLLGEMRKHLPEAYYGLLYTNLCREKRKKKKISALDVLISCMALNFLAKPNFIAFNKHDRNSFPVRLTTRFFGAPKYVWTIRNDEELEVARKNGECPIFEHCNKR